jgi:MscS family membrane protein
MRFPGRRRWAAASVLLLAALAFGAAAQLASGDGPKAPAHESTDPLGRNTPRGTVVGFIRAAGRDDAASAAKYLQVPEKQRARAEVLVADLKALMDRYFSQPVTSISDSPEGALNDALPADRERVGALAIGTQKLDVTLVRVSDPQAGLVWLISSETLAKVPQLRMAIASTWIERTMPTALQDRELFGLPWAHWIVLVGSVVVPVVVLWPLSAAAIWLARRIVPRARRHVVDAWYAAIRWPVVAVLALVIHLASLPLLGFPLTFRVAYLRVGLLPTVIAFAWLVRRALKLGFAQARSIVWGKDRSSTQSLMLLGERLLQALVVVVALLAILAIAGVDTKTALTGLGIGGVALALGAQKTVENVLGGVFLLSDRALAVGDLCRIADRMGWVEDITLRSVRLRTPERTLVSVPAGVLAQAGIENYTTREKILAKTLLRLRYGTNVEQLRTILDGIRALLEANLRIEAGSSRIRLIDFGERAVELELFAYVLTADLPEFMAIREGLLLDIAGVVEAAGSAFAQPTEFIYMDDKPGATAPARTADARDRATPARVPEVVP